MTNSYQSLGAMTLDAEQSNQSQHSWTFRGADGARAEVAILAADLARVRLLPQDVAPATSWAVERTDWPNVNVKAETRDGGLTLTTAAMTVEIATDPFRITFPGRTARASPRTIQRWVWDRRRARNERSARPACA